MVPAVRAADPRAVLVEPLIGVRLPQLPQAGSWNFLVFCPFQIFFTGRGMIRGHSLIVPGLQLFRQGRAIGDAAILRGRPFRACFGFWCVGREHDANDLVFFPVALDLVGSEVERKLRPAQA